MIKNLWSNIAKQSEDSPIVNQVKDFIGSLSQRDKIILLIMTIALTCWFIGYGIYGIAGLANKKSNQLTQIEDSYYNLPYRLNTIIANRYFLFENADYEKYIKKEIAKISKIKSFKSSESIIKIEGKVNNPSKFIHTINSLFNNQILVEEFDFIQKQNEFEYKLAIKKFK